MSDDKGWIKIHRELLDKPIWQLSTPEQKSILITLLLMANHREKSGNGTVPNLPVSPVNLSRVWKK
ncbi:hypothetical protein LC724_33295 [Blautia sp. RD014234]|nr:hypothetical protein [Blautia parvula]